MRLDLISSSASKPKKKPATVLKTPGGRVERRSAETPYHDADAPRHARLRALYGADDGGATTGELSMLRHRTPALLLALPFLFVQLSIARAQSPSARAASQPVTLSGHVFDQMQGAISGARITVTSENGVPAGSALSDERGQFAVSVGPGRYTVTVAADGFATANRGLDVSNRAIDEMDFVLVVAGVHETVDVTTPSGGYQLRTITTSTKT